MNTSKHTPGPFKAVQIIIENSPSVWAVQRASIREQWGKPSLATYIDNEADARLFAAAPAMYEALQNAIDTIAHMRHYYAGRKLNEDDIQKIVDEGRVALAQAEGGAK